MSINVKKKWLMVLLTIFTIFSFSSPMSNAGIVFAATAKFSVGGIYLDKKIAGDDKAIKNLLKAQGREKEFDDYKKTFGTVIENIKKAKYKNSDDKNFVKDVKAANDKYVKSHNWEKKMYDTRMITAPGFLTGGMSVKYPTCYKNMADIAAQRDYEIENYKKDNPIDTKEEFADSDFQKKKGSKTLSDVNSGLMESVISSSDATDNGVQKDETGLLGAKCGTFSVMDWFSDIYRPVNVTSNSAIMDLTFGFQIVALGLSVLLISVYAIYYALGQSKDDPIKFVLRTFVTLLLVFYLPYFAQDILNVNNTLVTFIAGEGASISGGVSELATVGVLASLSSLLTYVASVTVFASIPGVGLFLGIFLLIVVVMILKAVFTIVFWWYARFLMIMFLTVLGPLFMVMMLLPQTASYSKRWFSYFIGETATQFMLALGVYFTSKVISNIDSLGDNMGGFSIVGQLFLVYASIILLTRMPQISKSLIGSEMSGAVGWNDAKNMANKVGNAVNNAGMALVAAAGKKINKNAMNEQAALEEQARSKDPNIAKEASDKLERMKQRVGLMDSMQNYANVLAKGDAQSLNRAGLNWGEMQKNLNAARQEQNKKSNLAVLKDRLEDTVDDAYDLENKYKHELSENDRKRDNALSTAARKYNDLIDKAKTPEEKKKWEDKKKEEEDKIMSDHAYNKGKLEEKLEEAPMEREEMIKRAEREYAKDLQNTIGDTFANDLQRSMAIGKQVSEDIAHARQHALDKLGDKKDAKNLDETVNDSESKLMDTSAEFNKQRAEAVNRIANQLKANNPDMTEDEAMMQANNILNAQRAQTALMKKQKDGVLNEEESAMLSAARATLDSAFKENEGLDSLISKEASALAKAESSLEKARNNFESASEEKYNNQKAESAKAIAKKLRANNIELSEEEALDKANDLIDAYQERTALQNKQKSGVALTGEETQKLAAASKTISDAVAGTKLGTFVAEEATKVMEAGAYNSAQVSPATIEQQNAMSTANIAQQLMAKNSGLTEQQAMVQAGEIVTAFKEKAELMDKQASGQILTPEESERYMAASQTINDAVGGNVNRSISVEGSRISAAQTEMANLENQKAQSIDNIATQLIAMDGNLTKDQAVAQAGNLLDAYQVKAELQGKQDAGTALTRAEIGKLDAANQTIDSVVDKANAGLSTLITQEGSSVMRAVEATTQFNNQKAESIGKIADQLVSMDGNLTRDQAMVQAGNLLEAYQVQTDLTGKQNSGVSLTQNEVGMLNNATQTIDSMVNRPDAGLSNLITQEGSNVVRAVNAETQFNNQKADSIGKIAEQLVAVDGSLTKDQATVQAGNLLDAYQVKAELTGKQNAGVTLTQAENTRLSSANQTIDSVVNAHDGLNDLITQEGSSVMNAEATVSQYRNQRAESTGRIVQQLMASNSNLTQDQAVVQAEGLLDAYQVQSELTGKQNAGVTLTQAENTRLSSANQTINSVVNPANGLNDLIVQEGSSIMTADAAVSQYSNQRAESTGRIVQQLMTSNSNLTQDQAVVQAENLLDAYQVQTELTGKQNSGVTLTQAENARLSTANQTIENVVASNNGINDVIVQEGSSVMTAEATASQYRNQRAESTGKIVQQLKAIDGNATQEQLVARAESVLEAYEVQTQLESKAKGGTLTNAESSKLAAAKQTISEVVTASQSLSDAVTTEAYKVVSLESQARSNIAQASNLASGTFTVQMSGIESAGVAMGALQLENVQGQVKAEMSSLASGKPMNVESIVSGVQSSMREMGYQAPQIAETVTQVRENIEHVSGSINNAIATSTSSSDFAGKMVNNLQSLGFNSNEAIRLTQEVITEVRENNYNSAVKFADMYNANLSDGAKPISVPTYDNFKASNNMSPIEISSYTGGVQGVSVMPTKAIDVIAKEFTGAEIKSVPTYEDFKMRSPQAAAQIEMAYGETQAPKAFNTYANAVRESVKMERFIEISDHIKDSGGLKNNEIIKDNNGNITGAYKSRQEVVEIATEFLTKDKGMDAKAAQDIAKSYASEQVDSGSLKLNVKMPSDIKNLAFALDATTPAEGSKDGYSKLFGDKVQNLLKEMKKVNQNIPKDTNN